MTELEALELIAERIELTNALLSGNVLFVGVIVGVILAHIFCRRW